MSAIRTLLQFTDLHLYATPGETLRGVATNDSFTETLAAAGPEIPHADALLLTGDLAQEESPETYAWLNAQLSVLPTPCYAIPGNHDDPALLASAFADPPLACTRVIDLTPWSVLLLDTRLEQQVAGRLGQLQLSWLDAELRRQARRRVVLAMHHPPVPVGCAWLDKIGLTDSAALWAVLERHGNVRAIVSGHVHLAYDTVWRGIRCLSTPSTCMQFVRTRDDFAVDTRPPGYRLLRLYPDGRLRTQVNWCRPEQAA